MAMVSRRAVLGVSLLLAAPLPAASSQLPNTTRKVVLDKTASGYRWKLTEAAVPAVGDHQVLVHVRAVSINRGDLDVLEPGPGPDHTGLQVATDAAGDVVAVGGKVRTIRPGSRVTSTYFRNWTDGPASKEKLAAAHGMSVDGVLADYIVLEDTAVAPIPAGLSYTEASTLPTAGLTAWMASVGARKLRQGDVVVVQGTGGVSTFALQFAGASGARVILTSSSDDKLQRTQAIARHDSINYRKVPEWSSRVLALTDGHGADLVVDIGGKSTLQQSLESLAYGGTVSIVGGLSGYDGQIPALSLLLKAARAQGVYVGSRADHLRMNAFISAHGLHPIIDRVFALEEFAAALKYMAQGNFVGKIVIRL